MPLRKHCDFTIVSSCLLVVTTKLDNTTSTQRAW